MALAILCAHGRGEAAAASLVWGSIGGSTGTGGAELLTVWVTAAGGWLAVRQAQAGSPMEPWLPISVCLKGSMCRVACFGSRVCIGRQRAPGTDVAGAG